MATNIQSIDFDLTGKQGLPGFVFKDSDVYEKERNRLFQNGWSSIACAQQLKEPGDILPVNIAGHALIVLRNNDGEIGVFYNVCRHKAAPLIDAPCSKATALVCPYHRWTYKLDGSLRGVPNYHGADKTPMSAEEKANRGLLPVRFAIWWDIVFVNMSGDAEDFEDFIKPLDEFAKDYQREHIQLFSTTDYKTNANWKLAVDNFLDGYHVAFVHAQACTLKSSLNQRNLLLSKDIIGLQLPDGASEKPAKTSQPMPGFSGLTEDRKDTQQWFCLFPNTLFFIDPGWVQTIIVKPQSALMSTETLNLYVTHPDAMSEAFTADRAALSRALNEVNEQDIQLLDKLQTTRSSEAANLGNLTAAWDVVNATFQQLWLEKMR